MSNGNPLKMSITIAVLIVITGGFIGGCELLNRKVYIEGDRVGYIVKFSKRGYFWKAFHGEVNMGGINNSMGSSAMNIWYFSLDNQKRRSENLDSLAKIITAFLSSGQPVKITYYAPCFTWPWRSSNRYLVQSVEPISNCK